jgi:formiminoglutamase
MTVSSINLVIYDKEYLLGQISSREGEAKIGQELSFLASPQITEFEANLHLAALDGARFAVLGVPEDIGSRANYARGGADGAWKAFLQAFLNFESNQFFNPGRAVFVGHIQVADLIKEANKASENGHVPVHKLRELCGQLDKRMAPVIELIVAAGLEPVVVGGGKNNTFPLVRGTVAGLRRKRLLEIDEGIVVVNCSAHAEFRILEGRHSGNAFTYADADDLLKAYFVLGLQEAYNAGEMLDRLASAEFQYVTYEQMAIRREFGFEEAIQRFIANVHRVGGKFGLELNLDALANIPSSGLSAIGISFEQASRYIYALSSTSDSAYFHIAEGAPALAYDGETIAGSVIANLVLTYMKGREEYRRP